MSDEEKRETEKKKREGSRQGRQHVANTEKARQARKGSQAPLKDYDDLSVGDVEKKLKGLSSEEIREVRDYEKRHKNRKTLLESLDRKV